MKESKLGLDAKARLKKVDELLALLMSGKREGVKLTALASFLDDGRGVVAAEVYGMSIQNILAVFSSKDVELSWKRRRLMTVNCGNCLPCDFPVKEHACAWVPWYPLEFADCAQRWSRLGMNVEAPDEEFVEKALSVTKKNAYDKLLEANPTANVSKLLFHRIAGAENKWQMNRIVRFIGADRVAAMLDADGHGMVLSLAYLLGMGLHGYGFESKGSTYGLKWLDLQRPGIVAAAQDRFGNNAQHYLLAGYGRMSAPCYAGCGGMFYGQDLEEYGWLLGKFGCGETVKNGFGFSVSELMARSDAPKEDW